jgi:hypothetical protein
LSDIITTLATTLAKQGAPVIGGLIGTAIGGPVGAAVGGLAGKAIEELASQLGTPATPEAVLDAVKRPDAPAIVREIEARQADLLPLWQAQMALAHQAQTAEIERGFSSWNWRRNFAHYVTWGMTGGMGAAAATAAFTGNSGAAALASLFGTAVSLTMAWLAVNSGGKALGDFAAKWKQ